MHERLENLLRELVGLNSISPTLAGGPGESEIAAFVMDVLAQAGHRPSLQEPAPGRPNVVATIRGTSSEPSILLNAHLDTVGVDGMKDPFVLRREGDRLYGRGAYDMKGSVTLMLALAQDLAENPPPGDVLLTFVCDEEDRSMGMEHLVAEWLPTLGTVPDAAIVLEPTEEKIAIAHKGFSWFEIEILGRAAHGSRPEEGVDAAFPLAAALAELVQVLTELEAAPGDALLGRGSLHVGRLEAGSAWSVIPETARLGWERRTLPGETSELLNQELERVIRAVEAMPGSHRVEGRRVFDRRPHRVPTDSLPVRLLQAVLPDAELVGVSFWADSALLGRRIPTVLYGPIGHGAHAEDEWVSLESLVKVYETLTRVIRRADYSGKSTSK